MSTKCTYIDKDSKPCEALPLKDSNLCYWHTPELKETRLQASKRGGLNRRLQGVYGDGVELNKPRDAERLLAKVVNAVWTGAIPVQTGTAMAFLTKCWLEAYKKADKDENPYSLTNMMG